MRRICIPSFVDFLPISKTYEAKRYQGVFGSFVNSNNCLHQDRSDVGAKSGAHFEICETDSHIAIISIDVGVSA